MMAALNARALIAVVAAGAAGALANAAAIAIVVSPDRLALALVPGRYVVAVVLCLLLPLLLRRFDRRWFFVLGIVWLTVAASILAKVVFGAEAPWSMVLAFNLVYAVAAIVVFYSVTARFAT